MPKKKPCITIPLKEADAALTELNALLHALYTAPRGERSRVCADFLAFFHYIPDTPNAKAAWRERRNP